MEYQYTNFDSYSNHEWLAFLILGFLALAVIVFFRERLNNCVKVRLTSGDL